MPTVFRCPLPNSFTVLDLSPILFRLAALGSGITILVVVHMQRLFRTPVLTSR